LSYAGPRQRLIQYRRQTQPSVAEAPEATPRPRADGRTPYL